MLHVKFENCKSCSFIEEEVKYLFCKADGCRVEVLTDDAHIGMATVHYDQVS